MIVRDEAAADIRAIFEIPNTFSRCRSAAIPVRGAVTFHPAFGATS